MPSPTYQRVLESGKPVKTAMRQLYNLTIENTEDTSDAVDLHGEVPVGLIVNDDWTSASLVVEVSFNGSDFFPVYDHEGNLIVVEVPDPDVYIALPTQYFLGSRWLRLVSVDEADPTTDEPQLAERTVTLVTVP